MIHPDTEVRFISEAVGYGVVAKKLIPKGTITWVLDGLDREFSPRQFEALPQPLQEMLDTYAYRNHLGHYVLCWDNARFVNHSFNANCLSTPYDFELAIRDIQAGEQLTDDYGYLNVSSPFRAMHEGTRRKTVYPDDLLRYHQLWDKKLATAFRRMPRVEQALSGLLSAAQQQQISAVLSGDKPLDSIINLYYNPNQNSDGAIRNVS